MMDLIFDKNQQSLSCISIHGPPTKHNWSKDGQMLTIDGTIYSQRQTIVNASSSTYITTIFIRLEQPKIVGNYSCMVSNSRVIYPGENQHKFFEIRGKYLVAI